MGIYRQRHFLSCSLGLTDRDFLTADVIITDRIVDFDGSASN